MEEGGGLMHHYAHHIGDYRAHTAHLTFLEDAAYRRLLDRYYMTERPLEADLAALQRLVGARDDDEKRAVETVLQEFFTLQDDGWHQSRADDEIAAYQARAEAGRKNGAFGGRPKPEGNRRITGEEPDDNRKGTATKNHEPITNNQVMSARARKTRIPDDFDLTAERLEYAKSQGCADPTDTFNRFKLHHASKGTLMLDWDKAWQYWCRNEKNFQSGARGAQKTGAARTETAEHDTDDQWRARLRGFDPKKPWTWNPFWGPKPGEPGCFVPKDLMEG